MSAFAYDPFPGAADTELAGTTALIGGVWSLITPDGKIYQDGAGGIFLKQFGSAINSVYTLPVAPPGADYYTQFVANYISGNFQIGTVSRVVDGSNYWTCNVAINQITVNWVIANIDQPGGIVYAYDITAAGKNRPTIALYHSGNNHYLLVNGAIVASIIGETSFPSAGTVGVISRGNNCAVGTGMHLELFQAYVLTPGLPVDWVSSVSPDRIDRKYFLASEQPYLAFVAPYPPPFINPGMKKFAAHSLPDSITAECKPDAIQATKAGKK